MERRKGSCSVSQSNVVEIVSRVCSCCVHHTEGQFGVWCTVYREQIDVDEIAEECGEFERE